MPTVRVDYVSAHGVVVGGMREIAREGKRMASAVKSSTRGVPLLDPKATAKRRTRRGASPAVREAKEAEKAAKAAQKAYEKKAAARRRSEDKELRALERRLNREMALERRQQAQLARLQKRHAAKRERDLARQRKRFAARVDRVGSGAIRGVGAAGALAVGAAGALARRSVLLDDFSKKLSIKGGGAVSASALRAGFERTSQNVKGSKALDVAEASAAFVSKTGDLKAASQFQRLFAEYSVAADASAQDIGSAAADIFEKFDIKSMEGMNKALAILTVQGKKGSFELADAAAQFPKILAAARSSGLKVGKGADAIATIGGFTQVARGAVGSPEAAATAVNAAFTQILAGGKGLKKKYGIDAQGTDFNTLLGQIIANVGGDDKLEKTAGLQKMFGRQGFKAIAPLLTAYNKAVAEGRDGQAAVVQRLRESSEAIGAEATVRRDLATAQQTSSAQLTHTYETLTAQVGSRLVPMATRLAQHLSNFVATTDFEPLQNMIEALTHSMGLLLDVMKRFGLVKERSFTPEEREEKARRAGQTAAAKRELLLGKARKGQTLAAHEMQELHRLNREVENQAKLEQAARAELEGGNKQHAEGSLAKKLMKQGVSESKAHELEQAIRADPVEGAAAARRATEEAPMWAQLMGPLASYAYEGAGLGRDKVTDAAITDFGASVSQERAAAESGDPKAAAAALRRAEADAKAAGTSDQLAQAMERLMQKIDAVPTNPFAAAGAS